MHIRDLGPLRVESDGIAVPLKGRRLESVLAVLCALAPDVVSVDALINAIWGEAAPDRAAQSLESLIWRLRKVLEPDRATRQTATLLQTEALGYRLALPRPNIDSHQLLDTSRRLSELMSAGRADLALDLADAALALWRGQPYLGVPDADWMPPVRARLAEAHLELQHYHVEALLATAQPERALDNLVGLLAEHPYRERLWGQRMLALYRCGRQSEALQTFAEARAVLAEELGVDPGPELRELHQLILDQDHRLDPAPSASARATAVEVHLPSRRAKLVGRDADLSQLRALLQESALITLTGPGGCGKTRLAIEVAYLSRARFADGVWFIDLADVDGPNNDPNVVWSNLASTLGLALKPGEDIDVLTLAFLSTRAILLVFDNCEHVLDPVAAVVDQVLASAPGVSLLATSREPLDVTGEHVHSLAPLETPTETATLADSPAVQLLTTLLGDTGFDVDLDGPDGSSIRAICVAVGGLPLGLELAAARARNFELAEVAAALQRDPTTMTRLGRGPQRQLTLYDTIDWSHRLARADEQILHRRLSIISGPFTAEAAEGLCALAPLRPEQGMDLIAGLAHRSLLNPARSARPGGPSAFIQLVPIRAHARASLTASRELTDVETARTRWVLSHLHDAPNDGRDGQAAWYDWLEDNQAVIDGALTATLINVPSATGLLLTDALTVYWHDRSRLVDGMRWLQAAVALPDLDPFDHARADASYGCARALNQERELAQPALASAISIFSAVSTEHEPLAGELLVRIAAAGWAGDLWTEAMSAATRAKLIGEQRRDPHLTLRARAVLSACELTTGDPARAVGEATAVLEDNRDTGNHFAAFFACVTNGIGALFSRDAEAGLHWTAQAMRHQRALGVRNVGDTLEQRGSHYANAGQLDAALRCYGAACALHEREGRTWPRHPGTPETLELLRSSMTPSAYERNWSSGQRQGRSQHDITPGEWG